MIEMDKCTPYQWCLDANMRILDLLEPEEKWYYTTRITKEEFMSWLTKCKVKPNSTPRKTDMYLEYRMYGIVPYNISPIQAGIQFGHAVVEYQQNTRGLNGIEDIYNKWASQDKTFIICNGGTTNENPEDKWYGSMQKRRDALSEAGILFAEFREPDLNNTLTAVVFLVDERVFNEELYPNYVNMPYPWEDKGRGYKPKEAEMAKWEAENAKNREKWIEKIGGHKNDFLRVFCNKHTLRLATN
jgi:hypothetical protein